MASSKRLRETVGDVTECPICTETMVDPRVLPCIHTFCFKCLDQLWKGKQPGVKVPCPMCRKELEIPVEGVSSLQKHFVVGKLIRAQELSKCENSTEKRCSLHKGKTLDIYCLECGVAVCTICFIAEHTRHACSDIQSVAEDFKQRIKLSIEVTRGIVVEADYQSKTLKKLMEDFEVSVVEAQSKIIETGEKMKQRVDQHVQDLLEELENERAKKSKEFETLKEELVIQKLSLESVMENLKQILENAIPADVASVAKDLSVRFESLTSNETIQIGNFLEMSFIPRDPQLLPLGDENAKNVLGKIGIHGNILCE